jgi:hypothetical protein
MTLENVTAPVADAHGNKVNHPHTLIMSKAKIRKTSLMDSSRYPNQPKKDWADFST